MKRKARVLWRVRWQVAGMISLAMCLTLILFLCQEEATQGLQDFVSYLCYDLFHIPVTP